MKLLLSSILLASATAQVSPTRLRSTQHRELHKDHKESNDVVLFVEAAEAAEAAAAEDEEFGRFSELEFMLTSMSMSTSLSMLDTQAPPPFESNAPTPYVSTEMPSPYPTTFTPEPTADVDAGEISLTTAPTLSKSGKENKKELVGYSWSLPAEYTGYFELYEGEPKGRDGTVDDLVLLDIITLGNGTSGSEAEFLPRGKYTVVVVNQDQSVGYCCEGSEPGFIHFHYGGIEYDRRTDEFKEKKDKDVFIAEFHRRPHKIDIGADGAYYQFSITL